ncbi:bag family molecular chaperone regulator 7 [Phtheirospermum japonicum]|uniref:Bag family molecular chaperone regulator 7 n=1 Tax=Phtheirospermum japonicum TaxID=374723 RepID=A0A830BKZ3_9LAMI|nr:bag family molecular chaperone regulator 7 [Phtheirospermum japonicum]
MSRFRRFEIVEHSPSYYLKQTSILKPPTRTLMLNPCFPSFPIVEDELDYTFDLLNLAPTPPPLFDEFGTITDLIQIDETPFHTTSTRRVTRRVGLGDLHLHALSDRVSALELGFDRLAREEKIQKKKKFGERRYTWTAEDEKKGLEKNYKWTAEIKRKGADRVPIEQTYTIKVSSGGEPEEEEKKKKCEKAKGKGKAVGSTARIVEIEEPSDHGGIVLRQVVAKTKLKEIRALFHNFSYRHRLGRDAEERQKFSEKIIVLLLTVDAIQGADLMVRAAKRSMVDELEAMLDVVDPQPPGKSLSHEKENVRYARRRDQQGTCCWCCTGRSNAGSRGRHF